VKRGDVYAIRPRDRGGREQRGPRYGVVVQADALAALSTVIVAPTSTSAQPASFRPRIQVVGEPTHVLVDQLTATDVTRLGRRAGRLDVEDLWALDDALRAVLDLI
jgi:mRNA interferase MazF